MSLLVAQGAWLLYFPMWGGMVCPAKAGVTEQVSSQPQTLLSYSKPPHAVLPHVGRHGVPRQGRRH